MAEIAVAARDLDTGYKKGDPISVLPDGWEWGTADTLPNIWKIAILSVPTVLVKRHILPLFELAIIGDPEWDNLDLADRIIHRHRTSIRVMWDEIVSDHPDWIITLDTVGRIELRKNEIRPYIRKLRYNRGQDRVEKTDERII